MDSFSTISDDLKINFTTGVKCFKSAMDIIQAYLDPSLAQVGVTAAGQCSSMTVRVCVHLVVATGGHER